MTTLTPVSSFDDVYQIEQTDLVLGGAGNVANQQAQDLTNRTKYLKDHSQKIFKSGALTVDLTTTNTAVKLFSYKYKVTANHLSNQRLNKALRFDVHYGSTADIYMSVMREFELNFMADKFFLKLSKLVSDFDDELSTTDNSPLDIYLIVRRRDDADTYTYFDFYLDDTTITETRTKDIEVVVYEPVDSTIEDKIIFESSLTAIAKMSNVSSSTVVQTSIHSSVETLASDNIFSSIVSTLGEINQTPSSATPESIINESRFSQMEEDLEVAISNTFQQWNYIVPGTYKWTCPLGVTKVKVFVAGGGGAGYLGAGGGGGGVAIHDDYTVVPGTEYDIQVGFGGDTTDFPQPAATASFFNDVVGGAGATTNDPQVAAAGGVASGGQINSNGGTGGIYNAAGGDTYGGNGGCGGGGGADPDDSTFVGRGGIGLFGGGGGGGTSGESGGTHWCGRGGMSLLYGGHGGDGSINSHKSPARAGHIGCFGGIPGNTGYQNSMGQLSFGGGGGQPGGGGGGGEGGLGANFYTGGHGAAGVVIIRIGGSNFYQAAQARP